MALASPDAAQAEALVAGSVAAGGMPDYAAIAPDQDDDTDGDDMQESDSGDDADRATGALKQAIEQNEEAKERLSKQLLAEKESARQLQDELRKKADKDANYVLAYDRALIEQIGTQEKTGHTICCPSFSCAYADAVLDGTVHDHSYYTCSCCTWPDWGGRQSSFRCVGTDEKLLREAYDQIAAGKPTVIHVSASYGEHWIALIGYENVEDPDHLTLANFRALDPWDGEEINAASRYALYGDGCEHISSR